MTARQKFEDMLYQRGLFESIASKIMDAVALKIEALGAAHKVSWSDPADGYPNEFYAALYLTIVKPTALEWLEQNMPQHFAKSMFQ